MEKTPSARVLNMFFILTRQDVFDSTAHERGKIHRKCVHIYVLSSYLCLSYLMWENIWCDSKPLFLSCLLKCLNPCTVFISVGNPKLETMAYFGWSNSFHKYWNNYVTCFQNIDHKNYVLQIFDLVKYIGLPSANLCTSILRLRRCDLYVICMWLYQTSFG